MPRIALSGTRPVVSSMVSEACSRPSRKLLMNAGAWSKSHGGVNRTMLLAGTSSRLPSSSRSMSAPMQ